MQNNWTYQKRDSLYYFEYIPKYLYICIICRPPFLFTVDGEGVSMRNNDVINKIFVKMAEIKKRDFLVISAWSEEKRCIYVNGRRNWSLKGAGRWTGNVDWFVLMPFDNAILNAINCNFIIGENMQTSFLLDFFRFLFFLLWMYSYYLSCMFVSRFAQRLQKIKITVVLCH